MRAADVDGNLYFKKLSDLSSGVYANYNDDRIVFYKDDWTGTDFVAYVRHFHFPLFRNLPLIP